ncbi:major capsid protein [Camelimonas lactis]|uniref:Major capsid protein E n=1 Tax=Camelimonas lactis TaxID=659006 RepID=A0A4R2GW41_9HYPH|nr:major capsid protein [Camelimonas lactis]TCO15218.1 major capsid protein E [Camelimonas lactis]
MSGMNPQQAAVIEPILSTHARGYRNAQYIYDRLAPVVDIPNRSMRVIRFGKEDFRKINTRRAPGAATARIQYGYASDPVALPQDSLEATVPVENQEEALKVPGFDLAKISVERVLNVFGLNLEIEVATKARDLNTYGANNKLTLAGASKWSDPDSTPGKDVDAARDAVRRMIGLRPNVMVLGPAVFSALKNHPKVQEKFKYVSSDSITTKMLASYFEVAEVVSGDAIYLPDTAADSEPAQDIWGGDAILAYVNRSGDYLSPSYGYTYRLRGCPFVETPYHERNAKSWIYPVTDEELPYITGAEAGFLFKDAA